MTLTKPGLHAAGDLPLHPTLTHPHTGAPLRALGHRKDGRAIWPCIGGADDPPADPAKPLADPPKPPDPANPPKPEDALGPAGLAALEKERDARKALEKELAGLAPLKKLAEALGGTGKPEDGKSQIDQLNERFAAQERALADERQARWRAEVQAEKGLTAAQAKRLVGSTREEMAADADDLVTAFGVTKPGEDPKTRRPGTPKPDPAQGPRPGEKPSGKEAGLAEAQKRFGKPAAT